MSAKKIKIPQNLWAPFIDVLYAAVLHIKPETANPECMNLIQEIIHKALDDGSLLVVDGKIINKKSLQDFNGGVVNGKNAIDQRMDRKR